MADGYTTPVEQIIQNLSLTCPNTPIRKVMRPEFQEPINVQRFALPMVRPSTGGLTLKGYGSSNKKNSK
jgi:hypothetical protein